MGAHSHAIWPFRPAGLPALRLSTVGITERIGDYGKMREASEIRDSVLDARGLGGHRLQGRTARAARDVHLPFEGGGSSLACERRSASGFGFGFGSG